MVMRFMLSAVLEISLCMGVFGQTFEVASVRPSPPADHARGMRVSMTGGPGTNDPGRFACENMDLTNLVTVAYGIARYQLAAPDWLSEARFDIAAKVPDGATREQFRIMLQNLLAERFALRTHREKKEVPGYELTVAKGGPKMTESPGEAPPVPTASRSAGGPAVDQDGFPILPAGRFRSSAGNNGHSRIRFADISMGEFAQNLSAQTGQPVTDATGLKGKYDLTISWVTDSLADIGPTLPRALQEQLGLKLDSKRGSIEVLVVDRIEKVPTSN
jgi:uncharacterized protein (TIGR03435 family)